jgi:hypothetical protein
VAAKDPMVTCVILHGTQGSSRSRYIRYALLRRVCVCVCVCGCACAVVRGQLGDRRFDPQAVLAQGRSAELAMRSSAPARLRHFAPPGTSGARLNDTVMAATTTLI